MLDFKEATKMSQYMDEHTHAQTYAERENSDREEDEWRCLMSFFLVPLRLSSQAPIYRVKSVKVLYFN